MSAQAGMSFLKVFKSMAFVIFFIKDFPLFFFFIPAVDYIDSGSEELIDYKLDFAFYIDTLDLSVVKDLSCMLT